MLDTAVYHVTTGEIRPDVREQRSQALNDARVFTDGLDYATEAYIVMTTTVLIYHQAAGLLNEQTTCCACGSIQQLQSAPFD